MIEDSSGDFFGTTEYGGAFGDGTVFEMAAGSGTVTILASFNGTNGANPLAGLVEDSSGNLFGTTNGGGASGDGTVFEVVAGSGTITALASFNGTNGANPYADLIEDSSGNLFGTSFSGGASGDGTIFKVAPGSGTITVLASFNGTNGANPLRALVEDSSGNLFGTTTFGGASGNGTVFEVAAGSSTITTLASFNGTNGSNPQATLVEDSSGNLFGTTYAGGASGDGTVFQLAAGSGTITTLVSFDGTNGANLEAGLIEDSNGNLFGTTVLGGTSNDGTVFKVAASGGTLTTLVSFNGFNGSEPEAGLIEDSNGNLYGTTYEGGAASDGTLFKVADATFTITATDAAGATASQNYSLPVILAPAISTTTLPNWTVNQPYNQTIVASAGTGATTFSVSAGSLPTGLSLNSSTGAITGTPTTTTGSPLNFTITATDAATVTANQSYTVTINAAVDHYDVAQLDGQQPIQSDHRGDRWHRSLLVRGDDRQSAHGSEPEHQYRCDHRHADDHRRQPLRLHHHRHRRHQRVRQPCLFRHHQRGAGDHHDDVAKLDGQPALRRDHCRKRRHRADHLYGDDGQPAPRPEPQ